MAADLIELYERIDFSRDEIGVLSREVSVFVSDAIHHEARPTVGRPTLDLFANQKRPVPTAVKSRAGTIANELRAVLDGLACQLAHRNGNIASDVYFPISKSRAIFEDDGHRKIRKLSDADRNKIIDLKPYQEENPLLFGLHEADRTRKHQRLAGCVGQSSMQIPGVQIKGGSARFVNCTFNGFHVENMTVGNVTNKTMIDGVGRDVMIASGVPITLPFEVKFWIAYADPECLAGRDILDALSEFAEEVEEIVRQFDD